MKKQIITTEPPKGVQGMCPCSVTYQKWIQRWREEHSQQKKSFQGIKT